MNHLSRYIVSDKNQESKQSRLLGERESSHYVSAEIEGCFFLFCMIAVSLSAPQVLYSEFYEGTCMYVTYVSLSA